ncbi:MAG: hypothetical protein KIT60_05820 [Burkholderiaceae bacterium]|nr:hypothetical protein [Burkholderiaceae bacterium]
MLLRGSSLLGRVAIACATLIFVNAWAAPKTVCTVTINSPDERDTFKRHLPPDEYRFVELVQRGQPDWLAQACQRRVSCDALIISGHFDDGIEFYPDRFENQEALTVHELQRASCSASCSSLFAQLKEVYLFGCNTLKTDPRHVAEAEVLRSLQRAGASPAEAERVAGQLNARYGESNRDRIRHIFKDVPVLYGFSSKAPLGRYAGPVLEKYFQSAPAGEVASGRPSPTLLSLFGPVSMVAVPGLTDAEPNAGFRGDMCGFADDQPTDAQKLAFLHDVMRRDITHVRMFFDHLEHYVASLGPGERQRPDVAAALARIQSDAAARERYLTLARDAERATVQSRMMALARGLGWLTAEQERDEFVQMIVQRMARNALGRHEVDLVCSSAYGREPALAAQVSAGGAVRAGQLAHTAVLACLGHTPSHEQTLKALTSAHDGDAEIAQVYLRHRPLADVTEVRALAEGIGRMRSPAAQVRALETLARQRLADPKSLQEIARLFPRARSLQLQRAIANILIRADHAGLARADLARLLRQHRLRSPDGSDVIDALIRMLQAA